MNILSIGNINYPKYFNNDNQVKAGNNQYFGLKLSQPIQQDTVSFKAKVAETMKIKQSGRFNRISTQFLDNLAAIAEKFKDRGVSFCREYCEINSVKSEDSCKSKIARSSSFDIRDQIRATLFIKDMTDMKLLNDILKEFELRELILHEDPVPIEDMIAKGYMPKKKDGDIIKVPDLDIRLNEGRENIVDLPENLRYSWSKAQKSGYEDIQMRLVRKYDPDKENPVKHELLILTGENYAIAKHREYKGIYSITRKLDALSITKRQDDKNPHLKIVKRYIDLIKQLCSSEISQKLYENAKNKDVYGIENTIPIKVSDKDIETLKEYFKELRKNAEAYYIEAKKMRAGNQRAQIQLSKEMKQTLQALEPIEQELIASVKKVNKGKFPTTMEELIQELTEEKEAKEKLAKKK